MRRFALVAAALFLMAVGSLAAPSALVKVAVLHRHGARTGLGFVNGSETCNYPFCRLNDPGKNMLYSLGQYLNATYGGFLLTSRGYNTSTLPSQSTAVDRVVVSAQCMLLGLFGAEAVPFVDYVPLTEDVKMSFWTSWPAWYMHRPASLVYGNPDAGPLTDLFTVNGTYYIPVFGQLFPELASICATRAWSCVSAVRDWRVSNISAGTPINPIVDLLGPQLEQAAAMAFGRMMGYDPTDDFKSNIGSYGFPLAMDILTKLSQPSTVPTFEYAKMLHYGAHDWTIFALLSALGIWQPTPADMTDPSFAIRYAEAVVFEYYANGSVAVQRGVPDQRFESGYAYTWTTQNVSCISGASGAAVYRQTSCPVDDLIRFVNTTAPQSPDGICYASQDDITAAGCDSAAAPTTSACMFYRTHCPAQSCPSPSSQLPDPAQGYACVDMVVPGAADVRAWISIAVALPCALLGLVLGYIQGRPIAAWLQRRDSERQRLVQQAS